MTGSRKKCSTVQCIAVLSNHFSEVQCCAVQGIAVLSIHFSEVQCSAVQGIEVKWTVLPGSEV